MTVVTDWIINPQSVSKNDLQESRSSVVATSSLNQFIKQLVSQWGVNKNEIGNKLLENLSGLQKLLSELANELNQQKGKLGSNVAALNHSPVRVLKNPSLPDPETIEVDINTALSAIYRSDQYGGVQEISDVQESIDMGTSVRTSDAILFFDNGRKGQISARISMESAEAIRLLAVINTVKNVLQKEL